jgi:hypothetical protein
MLTTERERGASPAAIAQKAADYWKDNFNLVTANIKQQPSRPEELQGLLEKYDARGQGNPPPAIEELKGIAEEAQQGGRLIGVGEIAGDPRGSLQALQGAFGISLAASYGRTLPGLLSVLSSQKTPTSLDLLVYRMFEEQKSGMGDNMFKLTDEQREYGPAEFRKLADLAKHPNPVARLIAVEMLTYVFNAKEDAEPALSAMMRGMKGEENPAVIKRVIERANRQRSKVYEQVLPQLSRRVEGSNPKLKDEAQRVIKAIEETLATP